MACPALHARVVHVVDRALAYDRTLRWPDARAFQQAVREALPLVAGVGSSGASPATSREYTDPTILTPPGHHCGQHAPLCRDLHHRRPGHARGRRDRERSAALGSSRRGSPDLRLSWSGHRRVARVGVSLDESWRGACGFSRGSDVAPAPRNKAPRRRRPTFRITSVTSRSPIRPSRLLSSSRPRTSEPSSPRSR